jgi:hypothetical protein
MTYKSRQTALLFVASFISSAALACDEPAGPCNHSGKERPCLDGGTQFCDGPAGEEIWGECLTELECTPGETMECWPGGDPVFGDREMSCKLRDGVPDWDYEFCDTPLVLRFSTSTPVEMLSSGAAFDISGAGECLTTDWPAAENPWLAIDLDRNGFIDGGHELFGSGSVLESGRHARNGFLALATLDSDRDGKLTVADARFAEILVWRDLDMDKLSLPHELSSLGEDGVQVIDLDYAVREECDERGNCGRERSSFEFIGASGQREVGEVVDVYLACQ